jgi:hypothetical protein
MLKALLITSRDYPPRIEQMPTVPENAATQSPEKDCILHQHKCRQALHRLHGSRAAQVCDPLPAAPKNHVASDVCHPSEVLRAAALLDAAAMLAFAACCADPQSAAAAHLVMHSSLLPVDLALKLYATTV